MSPHTSNGDGESLTAREGNVETNGRKKRRTIAPEDTDYMPPGAKRVSVFVALLSSTKLIFAAAYSSAQSTAW